MIFCFKYFNIELYPLLENYLGYFKKVKLKTNEWKCDKPSFYDVMRFFTFSPTPTNGITLEELDDSNTESIIADLISIQ